MIPDAPDDVRDAARFAFWEVQLPRDNSRNIARARERLRNIKSPRGIAGLKVEHGGGLWEGREIFDADFARLSFEEKKQKFMSARTEDAVPWQGVPMPPGAPGDAAFHAAGFPLLAWWKAEGRTVTANLGPDRRDPQPSETVRFLAAEFRRIAEWYGNSEWLPSDADREGWTNPDAQRLLHLTQDKALSIGFKVAQQHIQNRTAFR